jgi:hypothetical protein
VHASTRAAFDTLPLHSRSTCSMCPRSTPATAPRTAARPPAPRARRRTRPGPDRRCTAWSGSRGRPGGSPRPRWRCCRSR